VLSAGKVIFFFVLSLNKNSLCSSVAGTWCFCTSSKMSELEIKDWKLEAVAVVKLYRYQNSNVFLFLLVFVYGKCYNIP